MKSSCQNSALNVRQPFLVGGGWVDGIGDGVKENCQISIKFSHAEKKKKAT